MTAVMTGHFAVLTR